MGNLINKEEINRQHDLTIEEVKSFPMFAQFSDEQAQEVITTIKKFSEIIYKSHQKSQNNALKNH